MKIRIKRFRKDKDLPLPAYKSAQAAAMDVCAAVDVEIPARSVGYVPLNIAVEVPDDHFVLMSARSSLHKRGVMMANGIGIGDRDFAGDNDQYQAALFNFTDAAVTIERGERIVQMVVLPREQVTVEEVDHLGNPDRGGFGSTGRK